MVCLVVLKITLLVMICVCSEMERLCETYSVMCFVVLKITLLVMVRVCSEMERLLETYSVMLILMAFLIYRLVVTCFVVLIMMTLLL